MHQHGERAAWMGLSLAPEAAHSGQGLDEWSSSDDEFTPRESTAAGTAMPAAPAPPALVINDEITLTDIKYEQTGDPEACPEVASANGASSGMTASSRGMWEPVLTRPRTRTPRFTAEEEPGKDTPRRPPTAGEAARKKPPAECGTPTNRWPRSTSSVASTRRLPASARASTSPLGPRDTLARPATAREARSVASSPSQSKAPAPAPMTTRNFSGAESTARSSRGTPRYFGERPAPPFSDAFLRRGVANAQPQPPVPSPSSFVHACVTPLASVVSAPAVAPEVDATYYAANHADITMVKVSEVMRQRASVRAAVHPVPCAEIPSPKITTCSS